ncbi:MAG: ATP-binding cassette domain-containing protein, partial [Clostridiales bacterium]|nr:ATP-binding cassette domain-containing protein [Clostridiales bacterium]
MGIFVDIYRDMGDFTLDVSIKSSAKRIGILGASGSGKSMTLRMLAGIDKPDRGRIEIDGRVLYSIEDKIDLKPQKRNVGYMFQNYALFPSMTVLQN